jgi:alpha-galactosidase
MAITIVMLALLARLIYATITDPSISPTPPMGFNNWARFECGLNETLFVQTADAMVSKGLLAAGYNRLNLDDCWMQKTRAPNGSLQWNTTLFPQGIPWLAEHVKSKGFHFGIYEDSGNLTCGGYPGSKGYEALDAKTFSSWGIDYLKMDGCNVFANKSHTLQEVYKELYGTWHDALWNLTKPLIFSESAPAYFSGGSDFPKQENKSDWFRVMRWAPLFGELARHSNDIAVYGYYEPKQYWRSIMTNYQFEVQLARYQQPGFYNDPDFIIADWPWLSLDEKKSQFALWASFSAPLIISAYVPNLSADEITYLTNKDIIAVDQDPLALQATLVSQDGTFDVLTKSLANGDRLVTVLNKGDTTGSTTISAERLGLMSDHTYTAKDLWTGTVSNITGKINITLSHHATAIYRFSNISCVVPTGMIFDSGSMRCLTASGASVASTSCKSLDSQVWQVLSNGLISPLSAPAMCIASYEPGAILRSCDDKDQTQVWKYDISGNVVNAASKLCLTVQSGEIAVKACGNELDSQSFGLPSGVRVNR